MKYSWTQCVLPIAAIFSFRMLGLFMLIPVFTAYAPQLQGATPLLIGIALGGYGLSQGLLQIPFGLFSDRFGRKKLICIGLIFFILGSMLGALTHHIYGMIIARILQGMGAIGSVLIALLTDLTPEHERTKAMAIIGITIGLSFNVAMILSPLLTSHFGLASIFYLSAFLASTAVFLLYKVIPVPPVERPAATLTHVFLLIDALTNSSLWRLNFGIFFQHLILTSTFFIIPILLQQQPAPTFLSTPGLFYSSLMVIAFTVMLPLIIWSERKAKSTLIFFLMIALSTLSQAALIFFFANPWSLWFLLLAYFIGFNVLEASLPAFVAKTATSHSKGTAMGIYASFQFLGIFIGGLSAGFLYQFHQPALIFILNSVIGCLWLGITYRGK